jgi:hypothetical protein
VNEGQKRVIKVSRGGLCGKLESTENEVDPRMCTTRAAPASLPVEYNVFQVDSIVCRVDSHSDLRLTVTVLLYHRKHMRARLKAHNLLRVITSWCKRARGRAQLVSVF